MHQLELATFKVAEIKHAAQTQVDTDDHPRIKVQQDHDVAQHISTVSHGPAISFCNACEAHLHLQGSFPASFDRPANP